MKTLIHPTAGEAIPFVEMVQLPKATTALSEKDLRVALARLLKTRHGLTAAIEVASWYAHRHPAPEEAQVKTLECEDCKATITRLTPTQKVCAACRSRRKSANRKLARAPGPAICANPKCKKVFDPANVRQMYCCPPCYRSYKNDLRRALTKELR